MLIKGIFMHSNVPVRKKGRAKEDLESFSRTRVMEPRYGAVAIAVLYRNPKYMRSAPTDHLEHCFRYGHGATKHHGSGVRC